MTLVQAAAIAVAEEEPDLRSERARDAKTCCDDAMAEAFSTTRGGHEDAANADEPHPRWTLGLKLT
jgi:hypothetical protein